MLMGRLVLDQTLSTHIMRQLNSHNIQYCRRDIGKCTRMIPSTNLECILGVSSLRHDKGDMGSLVHVSERVAEGSTV